MDKLNKLLEYGQSYWLDNLTREKIKSGEIKKRVEIQGLRGITSNPSIFNKAISKSEDYDEQIHALVKQGKSASQIYDALTIKDVQDACDILLPVYESSNGFDGYVSLEVPPFLARDTEGTIEEARRLFKAVGKKNCHIKIPGTKEGVPAIEQMLYEGVNINITLLFSVESYLQVAQAYINAITRRIAEGKSVDHVISVASVFISRIDVLTDQLLNQYCILNNTSAHQIALLKGKAGIATARICYQRYKEIFEGDNWKKLEAKGAHVQRLLWASTSNKNPLYDDLRYVESLIGNNTINTLPDKTILEFSKHGELKRNTIEQDLDDANSLFDKLKKVNIDIDFITQQLEDEGIQKFTDAYHTLLSNIANKRLKMLGENISPQKISSGKLDAEVKEAFASIDDIQATRLLFAQDAHLWQKDSEETKAMSERMGWLTLPDNYEMNNNTIISFVNSVREEGFTHVVLLGMGGSSLCSEVAKETFKVADGYLHLLVLDNTDPDAIQHVESAVAMEKTLFIVASKSGKTQETLSFFNYFYKQLENRKKVDPGKNFIAITDHDTHLVDVAEKYKFRKVFINPPDLGGRYSVLSDFGLVPMALMGIDINAMLASAYQMQQSCVDVPTAANPGVSLGVALGIYQKYGRDKLTFVLSDSISAFGFWVEQLIAESTGKEGTGLIPIHGEPITQPEYYGNDRVFIYMYLASDNTNKDEKKINALEEAGHPVVRIQVANKIALGAEYYRWEVAVAIAGLMMHINPFNQPNVEESKKNTSDLLQEWNDKGEFKILKPNVEIDNISVYGSKKTDAIKAEQYESAAEFINNFIAMAKPNDYIAMLPYFLLTDERRKILESWREMMRDELKVATTLLEGPRYLHSTGQLHKGGPDSGLYIILMGETENDLEIPGEKYGFATLHEAQALGDFHSLDNKGRRVIRIVLHNNLDKGLHDLYPSIKKSELHHA